MFDISFIGEGKAVRGERRFKEKTRRSGDEDDDDLCRKFFKNSKRNRAWGTLQATCRHGVIYAISMISHAESPADVAAFLVKNIPELGSRPHTIVYDFACQASVYFESRYPELAKRLVWTMDRYPIIPFGQTDELQISRERPQMRRQPSHWGMAGGQVLQHVIM